MSRPPTDPPRLAPPGAGVPFWQRWGGRYLLLPRYTRRLDWEGARDETLAEGRALIELAAGLDDAVLRQRILVPPQLGLEDSSRYWSYTMVLEHLAIIGRRTIRIIVELTHGRRPPDEVRTADLKPDPRTSVARARERFVGMLDEFRVAVTDEVADRNSTTRKRHPWFGGLTAFQWLCFVPFHQRIHVLQAQRILRGTTCR